MNNRESDNRKRRVLHLALGLMTFSLCASAMAQQKPLTGQMLDGRTAAPTAATRTAQPPAAETDPASPQPATTHPTASARTQSASDTQPLSPPSRAPAQPPMPDYTDLRAPVANLPAVTHGPPPAPFGTPIGSVAHGLMHMQASNSHAVAALPTLGDEASAAYERYLQSFHHPIPVFFQTMVKSDSGSSQ